MTTKTLLIVGGALAGGFVLYELFKPGSTLVRPSTASKTTANGGVEAGLLGGLGAFLGQIASPHGGVTYGGTASGQAASPVMPLAWNQDPNAGIDPTTGGVKLEDGQTYGPPAPVSSGDDGLVSPTFF